MPIPLAFLGLDVGGTGAKAGVFDQHGRLLGLGRESYIPTQTTHGHTEISVTTIENAARKAAQSAIAAANARICAISIASQGQTFVSLDDKGAPLHPAIVWYDSRASAQAAALTAACKAQGANTLKIEPIASAAKILWLREHHPKLMSRAALHLLLPDYFAFKLTGKPATDPNTAASSGFFGLSQSDYSETVLRAAGVARETLAEVLPSGAVVGRLLPKAAESWGLPAEAIFVVGTNDQYAGALGAGNCRPGIVTETTGTCLALVTLTERLQHPLPAGLLGGKFPVAPLFFLLAYSKTAGIVLDWFRERFAAGISPADMDREAQTSPLGADGLTMLPHFDGTVSPVPRQKTRGAFVGIKLSHTRADFYRATLEALAFSLRECLEHLKATGHSADVIRSIGGGARSNFWLQIKADVAGVAVEKPRVTEAATLGAAMAAACGKGVFKSLAEASNALYAQECVFEPDPAAHAAYAHPFARYQHLMKTLYAQEGDTF